MSIIQPHKLQKVSYQYFSSMASEGEDEEDENEEDVEEHEDENQFQLRLQNFERLNTDAHKRIQHGKPNKRVVGVSI